MKPDFAARVVDDAKRIAAEAFGKAEAEAVKVITDSSMRRLSMYQYRQIDDPAAVRADCEAEARRIVAEVRRAA